MKKYNKYISLIISFIIFMIPLKVGATGSFDGFSLNGTYAPDNGQTFQAYTYDDGNGSDAALPNGFKYYYKFSDGKVGYFDRADVIANILNTKIGIVMEPIVLAQFIADYGSGIVGRNPNYYNTLKPVLKGDVLVGVALNGLTGGVIESIGNTNPNVSIPNTEVNNVYNFYQYWSELPEHKQLPEYITIKGQTKTYFSSLVSNTTSTQYKILSNASTPYFGGMRVQFSNNTINSSQGTVVYCPATDTYTTLDGFDTFCNDVGLTLENRTITWDELKLKTFDGTYIRQVNKSDFTANRNWIRYNNSETSSTYTTDYVTWGGNSGSSCIVIAGDITLWRNTQVVNQIVNNTYKPNSYTTNNYKNYNTGNDNSYTTTFNNVSNGSSSNSTVYNETNTSNNTNITNQITSNDNSYSYVDNSSVITNTTTIVNNYYNTNYPSNPDDPNDPSGGGGSGSGSGSDLEDDSILDALLAAILKLLRAIGKIIATILTGIIEIITDVLAAIANITTSFTGIIDFIASILGFLPSECIAVITLGLTLSVLIALLKMFGK